MGEVGIIFVGLAVFLFGTFCIVSLVANLHGDSSASYPLYAVRDRLCSAVVFNKIDRKDPCFDSVYTKVNSILAHSYLIAGAHGWPIAVLAGQSAARRSTAGNAPPFIPANSVVPSSLVSILSELDDALDHMLSNHMGIALYFSAKRREQRKIQVKEARELKSLVGRCHRPCTTH